jgi:hypothetical protein
MRPATALHSSWGTAAALARPVGSECKVETGGSHSTRKGALEIIVPSLDEAGDSEWGSSFLDAFI